MCKRVPIALSFGSFKMARSGVHYRDRMALSGS
jgi:hypothetical protein